MKGFFNEFKKFISRGNVMDMAVGSIIGAAFTKIVNSLVADIIMPPLGLLLGNIDFSNWFIVLKSGSQTVAPYVSIEAAKSAGATTKDHYTKLITAVKTVTDSASIVASTNAIINESVAGAGNVSITLLGTTSEVAAS